MLFKEPLEELIESLTYSRFMVYKLRILFGFGIIATTIFFVLKMISNSSPVTDEYCFAASVSQYGVWGAFLEWNSVWSPSLWYLLTLTLWSYDIDPLRVSQIMPFFSILTLISLSFLFLKVITLNSTRKNLVFGSLLYFSGLVFSFTLVQGSSLVNFLANPLGILGNLRNLFLETLIKPRDGELLQWAFSISLTWQKMIFGALLTIVIPVSHLILKGKISPWSIPLLGLLFLFYGPNSESLIYFVYSSVFSIYWIRGNVVKSIGFIAANLSLMIAFFLLTKTSGSNFRKSKFQKLGIFDQFEKISGLGFQIISMLAITLLVSYLLVVNLRRFQFQFNLEIKPALLWMMLCASISGNFIVAATSYVSAYHWISLVSVFFSVGVIFWTQRNQLLSDKFKGIRLDEIRSVLTVLLIALCFSLLDRSADLSQSRAEGFKYRKQLNSTLGQKILIPLPIRDLNGRTIVFDLAPGMFGISPMYGWTADSQIKCYEDLKAKW